MKIICVGLNYRSHNQEMERDFPQTEESPILFMKPDTALMNADKGIFYVPDFSSNIHYEAEVVVKINKIGKNIAERFAYRYYEELTIGIDFTARDLQTQLKAKGLPWEISKAFDNSAVVGTFVPKHKYEKSVDELNFSFDKNDVSVQQANTSEMIHSIDRIIAYASTFFTLKTGDLIFTGTPAGVGRVDGGDKLKGYIEDEALLNIEIR